MSLRPLLASTLALAAITLLPASADAQVVRPAAQSAPVPVRVEAPPGAQFALHRLVLEGPRSFWTGRRQNIFEPICGAPCDVQLIPGSYRFGISVNGSDTAETPGFIDVNRAMTLDIEFESRTGLRVVGWVIFVASLVGGAAMALAGTGLYVDSEIGSSDEDLGIGLMIGGLAVMLGGSLGVALPFIALNDHADVVVRN